MSADGWEVADLNEVKQRLKGKAVEYLEFLNVPALSCGLYSLAAGSKDMQAPHLEDEVYVVVEGRARLRIADKEHEISQGTILFVRATADHSFFDIEEDLVVLTFFGTSDQPL